MCAYRFGPVVLVLLLAANPARAVQATFAWDANPETDDVAGYRLYYDTDSGDPYEGDFADEGPSPVELSLELLDDPTLPQATLTGLPSCIQLFFAVTAYDTEGFESDYSDEINAVLVGTPSGVTVETADQEGVLSVSWAGDDAIAEFAVHYGSESGSYQGTGADQGDSPVVVASDQSSLTLTGLAADTVMHVAVEAICAGGDVAISGDVVGTTGSGEPIPADDGDPSPDGGLIDGDSSEDGGPAGDTADAVADAGPPGGDPGASVPDDDATIGAPEGFSRDSLVIEGGCAAARGVATPLMLLILVYLSRRARLRRS